MRVVYGQALKQGTIRRVRVEYRTVKGRTKVSVVPLEDWRPIPEGATLLDLRISPAERERGWPELGLV